MTRKLTISGAILVMVGLLATFGSADDVSSSAPAPAEITIPQSAVPIVLTKKEQAEPDVVEDETTSVLAVKTSDSESDTFIIQPSASLPEQPAEPRAAAGRRGLHPQRGT